MKLKNTLKFIKLNESGVRMLAVFIAILLIGQVFIKISQNNNTDKINPVIIGDEIQQNTHIVKIGETLWEIADKYFGNGSMWIQIAKENDITDPNSIEEGQNLIIPSISANPIANEGVLPTPSDINNPENTISGSTEAKTYTVKDGDTLWSIAESQFGSGYNWVDIKTANSIKNANNITKDQVLFLPNVQPKSATSTQVIDRNNAISDSNYSVEKGDNLWTISVRAYGDGYKWTDIAKSNSLTHPSLIYPGQKLSIPR